MMCRTLIQVCSLHLVSEEGPIMVPSCDSNLAHCKHMVVRLCRRLIHTDYFSRSPLNYETLTQRVAELSVSKKMLRSLILDYIRATRELQSMEKASRKTLNTDLKPAERLAKSLDLKVGISSGQLERHLWNFIKQHWAQCVEDNEIVASYVNTEHHVDIGRCFELVKTNFERCMAQSVVQVDPVSILLRRLLRLKDYQNCIGLLDATLNSKNFTDFKKRTLWRKGLYLTFMTGVISAIQYPLLPSTPFYILIPVNFSIIFGSIYAELKAFYSQICDRVNWRPHTSLLHRFIHSREHSIMNTIITHFEEHSEINMKNYHNYGIRVHSTLGTLQQTEFEMYLPGTSSVPSPLLCAQDEHTTTMTKYFREELQKRRMVWNVLPEERKYFDYWLSHGEKYEWVEPDQDPAEIQTFCNHSFNTRAHRLQ